MSNDRNTLKSGGGISSYDPVEMADATMIF